MVSRITIVRATLSVVFVLIWVQCASAMYDPILGRFAARDPIGYEGSKWNLSRYLRNSPLRSTDPGGLHDYCLGPACPPPTMPADTSDWKCKPPRGGAGGGSAGHGIGGSAPEIDVWLDTCCKVKLRLTLHVRRCFDPGMNHFDVPWYNEPLPNEVLANHFFTELSIKVNFLSVSPSPPCVLPKDYVIQACSSFPGRFISKLGTTFDAFTWPAASGLSELLSNSAESACERLNETPAGVP